MRPIVIVGPTGVGKTQLSIALAHYFHGEIINADSTQVYKELNIATAKITEAEKEGIPHHLFDICDLSENYSVYHYQKDCRRCIEEIQSRGHVPILVGGTGLYIKAALYDYQFQEETVSFTSTEPTEGLYQQLLAIDPNTQIHPHNRKRIIRALEYYRNHHAVPSQNKTTEKLLYPAYLFGLTTEREQLYQRINTRVDSMIAVGLLEEARDLYQKKMFVKSVMTPIGYKELFPYFASEVSLEQAIEEMKKNCRHYAKRQYTWFRNQLDVTWISVDYAHFGNTVQEIIHMIELREKGQ